MRAAQDKRPGLGGLQGLIGVLPISYIAETLSLEENNTLVYSIVIRGDGSFVVRNAGAVRENYFDRVESLYRETDGVTPEEYTAKLKEAIAAGSDYSGLVDVNGELRHMYCSKLPNSVWFLITFMPYGTLNESVETLGGRSLRAAAVACAAVLLVLLVVFLLYFRLNRRQIRELEAARKTAEEASRSKSEFLSNMSHDIRTPMNAIVGMTAVALTHIDDPQQVSACLKKITLSSRHLLGLINDVLDMSKIESGKMALNVELVSLREIMDNIVSIVAAADQGEASEIQHIHPRYHSGKHPLRQCAAESGAFESAVQRDEIHAGKRFHCRSPFRKGISEGRGLCPSLDSGDGYRDRDVGGIPGAYF